MVRPYYSFGGNSVRKSAKTFGGIPLHLQASGGIVTKHYIVLIAQVISDQSVTADGGCPS